MLLSAWKSCTLLFTSTVFFYFLYCSIPTLPLAYTEEGFMGSKPQSNLQNFLKLCLQTQVSKLCSIYTSNPKFCTGKRQKLRTKNYTLISHYASASGWLCPRTSYRDFAPGPTGELPFSGPHHVNPLHCKSRVRLYELSDCCDVRWRTSGATTWRSSCASSSVVLSCPTLSRTDATGNRLSSKTSVSVCYRSTSCAVRRCTVCRGVLIRNKN